MSGRPTDHPITATPHPWPGPKSLWKTRTTGRLDAHWKHLGGGRYGVGCVPQGVLRQLVILQRKLKDEEDHLQHKTCISFYCKESSRHRPTSPSKQVIQVRAVVAAGFFRFWLPCSFSQSIVPNRQTQSTVPEASHRQLVKFRQGLVSVCSVINLRICM